MAIPQTDPGANYLSHQAEIDAAIARVLRSGRYILGPETAAFEQEFASYLGAAHVIGVASGTDALELALRSCGLNPGDRVVTVSHTATATVAAIERAGMLPVLADIDLDSYTIDCAALEKILTSRNDIRAIVPVHLYGHPADMPGISELARKFGAKVIEDCAQSTGASISQKKTGTWGDAAAFSFYPTKNLGAIGDGGAIATNHPAVGQRARSIREYGWQQRHVSERPGVNSRLDEIQAAILRVKLRHLDSENVRRRSIAETYSAALTGSALTLPQCPADRIHVYHQYVIRSENRDRLQTRLQENGISTLVHYPVPVHLQPAYRGRLEHGPLDRTEAAAGTVLSLPMYPELTDDQVNAVIAALKRRDSE